MYLRRNNVSKKTKYMYILSQHLAKNLYNLLLIQKLILGQRIKLTLEIIAEKQLESFRPASFSGSM